MNVHVQPSRAKPAGSKVAKPTIATLFQDWRRAYTADVASDADTRRLTDIANAAENAMMALPTVTASDLAMKIIAVMGDGANDLEAEWVDRHIRPLIVDAPVGDLSDGEDGRDARVLKAVGDITVECAIAETASMAGILRDLVDDTFDLKGAEKVGSNFHRFLIDGERLDQLVWASINVAFRARDAREKFFSALETE
jgi:hypothetical protein